MKKALPVALAVSVFFIPLAVLAAGTAAGTPLVPGSGSPTDYNLCTLRDLANNLINFAVYLSVFVATLMFAYGGFLYVSGSANEGNIKKAHSVFTKTVIGLVIILIAWLIVNIVLSVLTGQSVADWTNWFSSGSAGCTQITTTQPITQAGAITPVTPLPGTLTDAQARAQLSAAGIGISSTGNCSDQQNPSCTSLEGIPASTIQDLITIKNSCSSCSLTVTGGTEVGHQSHGPGKPIVDLRFDQTTADFITQNRTSLGIQQVCTAPQDSKYSYSCGSYSETARQLHIVF